MKLLALDIGNSSTKLYVKDPEVVLISQVFYDKMPPSQSIEQLISKAVNNYPSSVLIFSSVVPSLDSVVMSFKEKGIKQIFSFNSQEQSKLSIHYDSPGDDRVAAAYGATVAFPESDLIVIDAGTAITVDVVTAGNRFEGGFIIPGISTVSECLNAKTALLMKSYPSLKTEGVGKSTAEALSGGLDLLFRGGLPEAVKQCAKALHKDFTVCITGGDCEYVKSILQRYNTIICKDLLASGLFEYCLNECLA